MLAALKVFAWVMLTIALPILFIPCCIHCRKETGWEWTYIIMYVFTDWLMAMKMVWRSGYED